MWLKKSKKRLAGAVLYQAMEQTRIRELASSISNPRTPDQMRQRVKWANLVNFYRANRDWMKYAFETKSANQSEYNKFMSVNVAASNIYLTKLMASQGACVVAPYIITQGSLTPIEITANNGSWSTNIYFPADFTLDQSTTVAAFTAAAKEFNPAIREGDQLSFIRFTQQSNSDTGAPYVVVRRYELLFNSLDNSPVSDYLPLDYIDILTTGAVPCLGVVDSGQSGGFVLILSRTISGKTYVSSQRIVVANNSATISAYSSAAALQAAVYSYGESADAFLSTNTAASVEVAPVALSILNIVYNTQSYVSGSIVQLSNFAASGTVQAVFNSPVSGTTITGALRTSRNATLNFTGTASGNRVTLTITQAYTATAPEYALTMDVVIDGETYRITFNVPSGGGDDDPDMG